GRRGAARPAPRTAGAACGRSAARARDRASRRWPAPPSPPARARPLAHPERSGPVGCDASVILVLRDDGTAPGFLQRQRDRPRGGLAREELDTALAGDDRQAP